MVRLAVCAALSTLTISASALQSPPALDVPQGTAIVLDGVVEDAEWKDAAQQELEGGGTLLLKRDGSNLFAAVRAPKDGWCHVYLFDGRQVRVLHASAALGAVNYTPDADGAWQPTGGFVWELRDRSMNADAVAARREYLQRNGWVASVGGMGRAGEREYIIGIEGNADTANWRMAVVYATGKDAYAFFPSTLEDDARRWELVMGDSPKDCRFQTARWARLPRR